MYLRGTWDGYHVALPQMTLYAASSSVAPNNAFYLQVPFRAQYDRLGENRASEAIEVHWLPKNASQDQASSSDIFRNLGPASPYQPAYDLFPETAMYQAVPEQCRLVQAHLLYRHGARYPSHLNKKGPGRFGTRVAEAQGTFQAFGDLAFLQNWTYGLGYADLVNYGAHDMFDAGSHAYYDYAGLLDHKLFVRTTSQNRMLESARYWALGFFGWDAPSRMRFQVMDEARHKNNTLSPKYSCKNARKKRFKWGNGLSETWRAVFLPPIATRLQSYVQGLELSLDDVFDMMSMCAYETVALGTSEFCRLFTKAEWEGYEYAMDLDIQGTHGFMGPLSKALGVGWVTEFLYRLKQRPFAGPFTSQNATLVTDSAHFPIHDKLYVDFTHDRVMTSILTALNMTQLGDVLDPLRPDPTRRYRASRITPFGARFAFEILDCGDTSLWIRAKINEAIVPLNQSQGCIEPRPDGLCPLTQFIQHVRDATEFIDFERACLEQDFLA